MTLAQRIGLLAIAIVAFCLWQLRELLLLGFTAILLATVLNKAVQRLQKLNLSRGRAIAITLVVGGAIALGTGWLIVPPFIAQFSGLMIYAAQGLRELRFVFEKLMLLIPGVSLQNINLLERLPQYLEPLITGLFNWVFNVFSDSLQVILRVALVLILSVMFLLEPWRYRQGFIRLFPAFYRKRMDEILCRCEVGLGGWLVGLFAKVAFVSILSAIALGLLQIPLPLANALLAGVLDLIPHLGFPLSVIPPMVLSLPDAPWKAIAVLGVYFLIQQLEGYLLVPLVMREQAALLPVITLLSQVVFTLFFGFLGLLLSLPLLIVAQVLIQEILVKDILDPWKLRDRSQ
jgi:predicted PurR-regulated permease PerM